MKTEAKIRNEKFVNDMTTAIAKAEQDELNTAKAIAEKMADEALSNDELEKLERDEARYLGRAEWVKKFTGVTPNEFDALKARGIKEENIAMVACDKYATRNCVELFKAIAHKDQTLIENANLNNYLATLVCEANNGQTMVDNGKTIRALGMQTNRQNDLIRNMLARLGAIHKCKENGERIAPDVTARGITQVEIDTKNKVWQWIDKVYNAE